ncbi:MAG: hypothetical protein RBT45_07610 [Acholeplasmataceae bacterium]|nr:hypothetical protein [Acholeplasmataceae bacterium]
MHDIELYQKYTMYGKETIDKKNANIPKRPINFNKDEDRYFL